MPHARSARVPSRLALVVALVAAALAVVSGLSAPAYAQATTYFVDDSGSDANPGTSAAAPFATLQKALDLAKPGTTINLAAGIYRQAVITKIDGTAAAPITIKGPETGTDRAGRYQATLYGTGRVISVDHSYYRFEGFTIDGQEQLAGVPFPTDLGAVDAFKDSVQAKVADSRLIYIGAGETTRDLTGITITNMFLHGAGGECIRMRNNAHDNAVTDSVIQYCGMFAKGDDDDDRTA
jgi:hypothetical protein